MQLRTQWPNSPHYGKSGEVRMVDVSAKSVTTRTAVAHAFVRMTPKVVRAVRAVEKSQGQSAGSGADSGDCGGEAHGGVDTSLSPTAADAH